MINLTALHTQRFFSYLSLFTFFMLLLVVADNFLFLFIGWEGVGICSYLLVNFWFTRLEANKSAMLAILINRVGDWGFSIGLYIIFLIFGTLDFYSIFAISHVINNENIITLICILLFIGAMAKSVRWYALFWNGEKISKHWPNMFLITKLGGGESPKLNKASSYDEGIKSNQEDWVAPLVKSSMIKTILFEVHLPVVSSHGLQLAWDRLNAANLFLELLDRVTACSQTNCINNFKVESEQSKEDKIQNIRISGLPKARNGYGNRGVVLPTYYNNIYSSLKIGTRGRTPDFNLRMLSTDAGSPVQIKSNTSGKLLKLAEYCKKNANGPIKMEKLYRLMYDSALYKLAYNKLKSNPGNMTPGINPATLDGMSSEVIEKIITKLKDCSFKFSPGRRVEIPKASEGSRPLTIAPPRDKIVQEIMRMILEVIFEPTFSEHSHGFRPGKSCHSALREIKEKFGVSAWYIEGDISKCFDSFDQRILMNIIEDRIKDRRFTDLIWKALKAGYFEFKTFKHSITGTPQGSIISPILSNIYLNELDKYINELKSKFDEGIKPKVNPDYNRLRYIKNKATDVQTRIRIHKLLLKTPYYKMLDPSFKKLVYVRYADDWIIGVRGSKDDCKIILEKIRTFLKDKLNLELSLKKTLITNAKDERALFLGTEIFRRKHQSFTFSQFGFIKRNGREVRLEAPKQRIMKKLIKAGFIINGEPSPRFLWLHNDKDTIITLYNSIYRGYINYYSFAENLTRISSWLHFVLKTSCAKLLASKFKLETRSKTFVKFGNDLKGDDRIGFVKAVYGMNAWDFKISIKEVIQTMYAETISEASLQNLTCAVCDSNYRVEMHHVRMTKDLNPKLNKVDALMAKRRRKQIPLCRKCHMEHHNRKGA